MLLPLVLPAILCWGSAGGASLSEVYAREVRQRYEVPPAERARYAAELSRALPNPDRPQYVVLVDRSPYIQALLLFWFSPDRAFEFIGASPVSTGKPGRFDYFYTPLGVFEHTVANLDFRALGTKNELGIRGYGLAGMRVFDFGWQTSVQGWGKHREGTMRLQMHATDPANLEKRLGTAQSKGCIRIPATLNVFFDRYGILDADYEAALAEGKTFWVLPKDRAPTPWSGRYLVIVDTQRTARPAWAKVIGR
ncbi:MAG: murein L,D-transpeptidase [Acidobacteriota bacterium]|nr:murein L,D-transpeptidase [Acidobacteriota bacterium]